MHTVREASSDMKESQHNEELIILLRKESESVENKSGESKLDGGTKEWHLKSSKRKFIKVSRVK